MLHDLAVLEGDVPAFDQLPVVGVGLGAVHRAVDAVAVRRAEDFLGGDVGDELGPVFGHAGSALPGGVVGQADGQVGAVCALQAHAVKVPGVELVAAGLGFGDMVAPGGDGVAGGDAADVKDQRPQLFDGFGFGQVGEDFFRPARRGHGHNAPLDAVVHRVFLPGLEEVAARKVDAVELARVQPGEGFGVFGMDGQGAAAVGVLGIVEPAAQLVGFEVAQVGLGAVFHADAGELFVLPAHDDLLGARLVARFGAGVGKLRHGDRAADDKGLARAHVDAHLDDEIGVKLQIGLVHGFISFAFAKFCI